MDMLCKPQIPPPALPHTAACTLTHLLNSLCVQAALLGDLEGSSSVEGASGSSGAAFKVRGLHALQTSAWRCEHS